MKPGNSVAPEEQIVFTSTPAIHSFGTTINVSVAKKNPNGMVTAGSILFGYANGVLLSLKVSPPSAKERFFVGIFSEMIRTAEKAVLHIHGELPKFSVMDYKTFF